MKFRFRFITSTLVRLRTALNKAYDRGEARLVRRISALLAYGQGQEVSAVADDLSLNVARNFDFEIQHKTKQGVTRSANGKSLF